MLEIRCEITKREQAQLDLKIGPRVLLGVVSTR